MANGTKKSFASGYGYGWDKEIYNPYSFGSINNPTSNYPNPANLEGPMGMINTNPVGNVGGDNPFTDNKWVNPGNLFISDKTPRLGFPVNTQDPIMQNVARPVYSNPNPGGSVSWMQRQGMNLQEGLEGIGANFKENMSPQNIAGVASGIGGIIQGLAGRGKRRDAQIAAQGDYDKMRQQYLDLDTSNVYADVENMYANLENPYEDLTVNRQQAEFEAQQAARSRANIMANLQSAAGASGIAGLAQAMANQGQIQAQQAAGSIGLQESRNIYAKAQGAMKIQQMERQGADMAQRMRLAGEETARSLDWQKTGTLFGMAQQDLAAANQAIAASDAALYGGIGQTVGTLGMMALSDRKLKKNINLVGKSPSGLNIYNFEYINSKYGDGIYQGVMSDEIPSRAIIDNNGYDIVDYSMIDVEFKRIN